ncbi:unnamed protein product, partial [Prorocentrum cordatum]
TASSCSMSPGALHAACRGCGLRICPYGSVLEAADGLPLVLAVGSDAQFRQLCELLGCPELASDQRFAKNKDRVVHRAQLQPLLRARVAAAGPREALLRECSRRKIPAGAVNDMAAVFAQPGAQVVRGGGTRTAAPLGGLPWRPSSPPLDSPRNRVRTQPGRGWGVAVLVPFE